MKLFGTSRGLGGLVIAALLVAAVATLSDWTARAISAQATNPTTTPFEVWLIDQQDTRPDGGGTLYIYDGPRLEGASPTAAPEVIDLGGAVRDLCLARTGTAPRRPHMLVFNGGDRSGAGGNTHAAIAFVATGHVVFLDAASRSPLECLDVGVQAHAVWPTPDQRFLLVANQNGKLFQRIQTSYPTNVFVLEHAATLDLANCTTPSGAPCQSPELRPDNAPICPRTTNSGLLSFVTLRGGGLFVVDHSQTPMRIVAEYDRAHVRDNGCGAIEANGRMYVNSGGGSPGLPHGHDLYAFSLSAFSTTPLLPNTPAPQLVYSRNTEGQVDAHGVALSANERYLWMADRVQNDVTVVDTVTNQVVNRFSLVGAASSDPAPDLFDRSPSGNRMFVSLRGPQPATGGHDAIGSTPGLGVIQVLENGRAGRLLHVARVEDRLVPADPHAIRVRQR
jgi:hypothetical protein